MKFADKMRSVFRTPQKFDPNSAHAVAEVGNLARFMEMVQAAQEHGRSANSVVLATEDMLEMTPLHLAAEHGHTALVKYILGFKPDVNICDKTHTSALHLASINNHIEVMTDLIKHGAKINCADDQGDTPLHWAATKGQVQAIELLLANKSRLDCTNTAGWTPLHRAAYNGRTEACKVLLRQGASMQNITQDGNTAVHLAALTNQLGCLEVLLQSGASTTIANKNGQVPLEMCISDGGRDLINNAGGSHGTQHPLKQEYLRTKVAPSSDPRDKPAAPSPPAAPKPSRQSASPARKPDRFGFPMEDAALELPSQAVNLHSDDPSSGTLFSYVSAANSRPTTSEGVVKEEGRPSSARKLVEALRGGSGAMSAADVGPWPQQPSPGRLSAGNLQSVDSFQEHVRMQSRQAATADALLNPAPRASSNKKFLDKYNLNRLNLFAP